ncbi:N-acetylglucosamine-6-phosphate deacetylase [Lachnoclostridium sp. An169]|uniref:N-acetylglucosamine-6-phosphate deacetylase n=1 Tax=Lachnoclostridium sp. An169 TaxID=1965569 RepID=UPI000B3A49A8|nr:N-acetylglucosamine-6-phosphate deacetylase [Lachnoclostridium sp. An169]OUP83297.1 N-acetylglucosamine-6-phosphate deacetylase [Lachnoclostridium sp. An169]
MIIKNVKIFGEDKKFAEGEIGVEGGRFVPVSEAGGDMVDGEGCLMIPGLVDIHFHGCVGDDFCDASLEAVANMAKYEASVGVTSICPATMTLAEEELHNIMKTAGAYRGTEGAKLVGINMEGPFISEKKKGAQAAEHIRKCDVQLFEKLQEESGGLIRLVDIAPENEGAMEFIDAVKDKVVVSIAHTVADYDTASEALRRGAGHVTHLYNAMPPLNHREPGVIGAARDDEKCHVEMICDGIHIHPSVVRATFAMFGADRIILISDSMRAAGLSDGQYTLGGQDVFVKGSRATLADGTIAGSVTDLMGCLRTVVKKMGIPLEDAVACASANPAKEIGIYDRCGSITEGKDADFVLLDADLNVKAVYVCGKKQEVKA